MGKKEKAIKIELKDIQKRLESANAEKKRKKIIQLEGKELKLHRQLAFRAKTRLRKRFGLRKAESL